MHVMSCVLPRDIRATGDYYKYLKLEQEGERLHNVLNDLERQFASVKNQALRYFLMMKELTNRQNCDLSIFNKEKK